MKDTTVERIIEIYNRIYTPEAAAEINIKSEEEWIDWKLASIQSLVDNFETQATTRIETFPEQETPINRQKSTIRKTAEHYRRKIRERK